MATFPVLLLSNSPGGEEASKNTSVIKRKKQTKKISKEKKKEKYSIRKQTPHHLALSIQTFQNTNLSGEKKKKTKTNKKKKKPCAYFAFGRRKKKMRGAFSNQAVKVTVRDRMRTRFAEVWSVWMPQ